MQRLIVLVLLLYSGMLIGQNDRVNGISLVASRDSLQLVHLQPLLHTGATHAAVMPFGFVRSLDDPEIIYNTSRQWFGETSRGVTQYVQQLHENGIQVMLKPQLWIWRGEFTGQLSMDSEEKWAQLEAAYHAFIIEYARLAEHEGVALFCIGTELEQFIVQRPAFWQELIREIRQVYRGQLTYAANWDEYKRVPFWDMLDLIGIDAYFPLSQEHTPSVQQVREAWGKWKAEIFGVSQMAGKPVLFTEYGYRSLHYAGREPWKSDHDLHGVNLKAQANLLTALYESLWDEPWFKGGFLWKWFVDHERVGGVTDNFFTPQNKPASMVVQYYYQTTGRKD